MDSIDRNILKMLQENGRMTNVELARLNGLAPSSMLERVRRLEERGIIRRYQAILDPKTLGYRLTAAVMINLNLHQASEIDQFEDRIRSIPEVRACYHITGRYDYIAYICVRDIDHLRQVVTHAFASVPGVEKQETFVTLSVVKEDAGYSLEEMPPELIDD
ncbi:MAG: Lrp/AsnC family transcriptional regulator [Bradymonadales bacterium]|nr:Lrp/AsnC family transcriptional regulator [Bradymonadales bacterium]